MYSILKQYTSLDCKISNNSSNDNIAAYWEHTYLTPMLMISIIFLSINIFYVPTVKCKCLE